MKFKIMFSTGKEQCVQCGDMIKQDTPYIRLIQNRWAKPSICKKCMHRLTENLDTIEMGGEMEPEPNIKITPNINKVDNSDMIVEVNSIKKNSWMW